MKHIQKLTALFLAVMLILSTSACGSTDAEDTEAVSAPDEGSAAADEGSDWSAQLDAGWEYYDEGDYENAADTFSAAIESEPNRATLFIDRGEAYFGWANELENDGDMEAALEFYEMAKADFEKGLELINSGEAAEKTIDDFNVGIAETDLNYIEHFTSEFTRYNEYGATLFSDRDEYKEFEEFSTEQQDYIAALITAVIENDIDSIDLDILGDVFGEDGEYYTLWNGYKVWFRIDMSDSGHTELEIEIRPENGTSYYLDIEYDPFDTAKSTKIITYTTCQCVDWQWNGEYNSVYRFIGLEYEGYPEWSKTTAGVMVNSKRDGTFTSSDGGSDTYADGVWVEDESGSADADKEYIGTIRNSKIWYAEGYELDDLYW